MPWSSSSLYLFSIRRPWLRGSRASGSPGGAPTFPSRAECELSTAGERVRVVFGYTRSYPEAAVLRERALGAGFETTEVARDGEAPGFVDDVPGVAAGNALALTARKHRLNPVLERDFDQ